MSANQKLQHDHDDVNNAFEDVFLGEQHSNQVGYENGYHKGIQEGYGQGYHIGYHRGAEIGAELGYYLGVVETYLGLEQKQIISGVQTKAQTLMTLISTAIERFPRTNDEAADIEGDMNQIRSYYKMLCTFLKLNSGYPGKDVVNF